MWHFIQYKDMELVLQGHFMMTNKCEKFHSNSICGLWEKGIIQSKYNVELWNFSIFNMLNVGNKR